MQRTTTYEAISFPVIVDKSITKVDR